MQNLIATTSEVVHYIASQAVHYNPLQEVHSSRYWQLIHSDDIPRKIISIKETAPAITGLRDSELTKLINLPIKENTDRWHVRNTFLFAMYEGGIRIGDVIQLRCPNLPGNV